MVRQRGTDPASLLLPDLVADFAELQRVLRGCRSASSLRALTRLTAEVAGLISLTLIKVADRPAARNWGRAAFLAAGEAGDKTVMAWVRSQEAYAHFYSGDLITAIAVAKNAQTLSAHHPGVGVALAAALEARAHAALGHKGEAIAAVGRAEAALSVLGNTSLIPSAFGYNEAQLRFHQGSALTRLPRTDEATKALNQALSLYPENDYMDRALVKLDLAACLLEMHDMPGAVIGAETAVLELEESKRDVLILGRVKELVVAIPARERQSRAARGLQDVLGLTPGSRESAD